MSKLKLSDIKKLQGVYFDEYKITDRLTIIDVKVEGRKLGECTLATKKAYLKHITT